MRVMILWNLRKRQWEKETEMQHLVDLNRLRKINFKALIFLINNLKKWKIVILILTPFPKFKRYYYYKYVYTYIFFIIIENSKKQHLNSLN